MTSDQHHAHLVANGFSVARRSYPGMDGRPQHYVLQLLPDGTRGAQTQNSKVPDNLLGRQFSIDLESGVWCRWGEGIYREFGDGPWAKGLPGKLSVESFELAASQGCQDSSSLPLDPFLSKCQDAGFELQPRLRDPNNIGDRIAYYQGAMYILIPKTECIVDRRLDKHSLDEFTSAENSFTQQVNKTSSSARESVPVHAPEFVSMKEKPVQPSGRTKQVSLF